MKSHPFVLLVGAASFLALGLSAQGAVVFTSQLREVDFWSIGTPTVYGLANGATPTANESVYTVPDFSNYSVGPLDNSSGNVYTSALTTTAGGATIIFSYAGVQDHRPPGNLMSYFDYTTMETRVSLQIDQPQTATFTFFSPLGSASFGGATWSAPIAVGNLSQETAMLAPGSYTLDYKESEQYVPSFGGGQDATFALIPAPEPSTLLLALFAAPVFIRRPRLRPRRSGMPQERS
jgi:hypothetical protein